MSLVDEFIENIKNSAWDNITDDMIYAAMQQDFDETFRLLPDAFDFNRLSYRTCFEILKRWGGSLEFITQKVTKFSDSQWDEFYLEAIKSYPPALEFVPEWNRKLEFCQLALTDPKNWRVLKHVPKTMFKETFVKDAINQSKKEIAGRYDITFIPDALIDNELHQIVYDKYKSAIQAFPGDLCNVPKRFIDENLCLSLVEKCGRALEHVPLQYRTYRVCLAAINNDLDAMKFIENPNNRTQLTKDQFEELCKYKSEKGAGKSAIALMPFIENPNNTTKSNEYEELYKFNHEEDEGKSLQSININKQHQTRLYNISLTDKELEKLNKLVHFIDKSVMSKKFSKKYTHFKYSLIKASNNNYFLIGKGQDKINPDNKNAFIGKGTFGKVKASVQLEKNQFQLTNNFYVVKIVELDKTNMSNLQQEIYFFNQINGYAELIQGEDPNKAYILMEHLPGIDLLKTNYANISLDELVNIFLSTLTIVAKTHSKGIYHGDIKLENVLYDPITHTAHLTDFGLTSTNREKILISDVSGLTTMFHQLFQRYLDTHITNLDFNIVNLIEINRKLDAWIDKFHDPTKGTFSLSDINETFIAELRPILQTIELDNKLLTSEKLDQYSLVFIKRLLDKAIKSNDKTVFEIIYSYCKSRPNTPIQFFKNDLFLLAVQTNRVDYIHYLIKEGVDPNQVLIDLIKNDSKDSSVLVNNLLDTNVVSNDKLDDAKKLAKQMQNTVIFDAIQQKIPFTLFSTNANVHSKDSQTKSPIFVIRPKGG